MDSDQQQQQQHYSATGAGSNKNIGHYSQQLTYLLGELKHIYDQKDDPEKKRKAAFERLAEISKIMRIILEKYSLLESKELLLNASQLVKAVKTYDYDNYSFELHSKLIDNINALYKSFQFNISNCLLQDGISMSSTKSLDNNNITTANKSQSSPTTLTTQKLQYQQQQQQQQQQVQSIIGSSNRSRTLPNNMFEEKIYSYKFGLDELIKQAKFWCKYLKELVIYIEKRAQIENEYNRSVMKNNQNISSMIQQFKNEKAFLPFHNNYDQLCQCEMKNVNMCYNNFDMLCKDILQPVNEFRTEFEKEIKKIKEEWAKASKQLNDAINAYSKSRENFHAQKLQDIDNNKIGMKLSYLENEFNEADATNTKYLCLINAQKELFNKSKRELINRLQNLMAIAEMKIKEITTHYFETLRDSIIYSPDEINSSLININQYEMGKPYRDFSNSLKITMDDSVIGGGGGSGGGGDSSYNYNPYASQNHLYTQPHYLTENIIDIDDSSDSDTDRNDSENFEVFMNKRQSQQQKYVRKESKAMTNKAPSAENIQIKGIEKKYKSVYHFKKGANCTDNEANHFFGKPLVQLSKNVALDFLKQCVHQIETRGSRISGIYRVSAVKSQVDSLTKAYETNPNSVDLSNISPNVIANLLKQFFRKLPEPLLTFQLYNEFIEVASRYSKNSQIDQSNEDDIVNRLKKICRLLPLVHYNTLRYLITHLKRISNDAEFNQMNPSNLGIVFGPTLLKKADNDDTNMLYDTNHQSRVIELFILYADRIFDINESENNDHFGGKNSVGLQRNNSFGQVDNNKGFLDPSSSSLMKENGDSLNNIFGNRLSKSATCSSINKKDLNQIKYDKNQAKYKFFHLDINNQSQQRFSSYSPQHIYSEVNSPKTNVNKVFTTITNYSNNNNRLVKNDVELSPFSQITAASKSTGPLNRHVESLHKQPQQQNHVKRIVSGYQMISRIGGSSGSGSSQQSSFSPQSSPTPIYARNNELSKSSSDIYTYKNINFSINSNEEHV